MAEEPMESVREILAEKYSDEQIVEVLGKEPVACRGKCNMILKKLTKLKTDLRANERRSGGKSPFCSVC